MRSADLTPEQVEKISEQLRPGPSYLHRLQSRMEHEGFPLDDPLYVFTVKAYHAVHDLTVRVHYLGCPGSVGERRP